MSDTVAGVIWLCLGVVLLAFAVLFFTEAFLFFTGRPLLTYYIRGWTIGHWYLAALAGAVLIAGAAMTVTHFILDATKGG